jgi:oligoendopeptidase F
MVQQAIAMRKREDIAPEYTWNAESVFESDAAWEKEYQSITDSLPDFERYKGHLGEGVTTLVEALEAAAKLRERLDILLVYTTMSYHVDTSNQTAASMNSKMGGLYGRGLAAISFIDPELLSIGQPTLQTWMNGEPRLAIYRHYIDNLFRTQEHVRSAEVEEVLGLVGDPLAASYGAWGMLTNADLKFSPAKSATGDEVPVFQGNMLTLMNQGDREARRTAWESYADSHLAFKNTLASTLSGAVKQDVFFARVRRYDSALDAALFRDNIPTSIFHNLIDVFKKNLPTWHRYWAVRKKALGYDQLYPYDIWAPLTKQEPHVSYNQAVDWFCEGLAPLGADYVDVLRRGCLQDRWVDIYPNEGKSGGAFSSGSKGTHPFIKMSYGEDLGSMGILVHELGHSMHSYYTWQTQPYVNTNYSIFVAEVASNFNQAMLRAHLFKNQPDKDFQLALIGEAMDNFHRYFFIMPTLARFELEFHGRVERGEAPSADDLIALMADLFSEGYGTEMTFDRERVGITWAEFGHLYANFYVFQYATGISAAHALSNRILAGVPGAVDAYRAFLRAGGSDYPVEVLKQAGVDLTTPQPVEETFAVLKGLVDRLESLIS